MEQRSGNTSFYGWINAGILFFLYFCLLGIVFYGFSVIFPQMVTEMGWNRGHAALPHSLRAVMVGVLAPVIALSINRIGSKKTFFIGLVVALAALILLATCVSKLWHWVVVWGVIMPVGFSFAGVINVQTTTLFWFRKYRSTAMGFVMSGAAVAGFTASPFLTWLMKTTGHWQTGWITCAGFIVLALIALFWLENKPLDIGQHPDGIDPDSSREGGKQSKDKRRVYQTSEQWDLKAVLKTRVVWLNLVVMCTYLMGLYLVMVHGVFHLTDLGYTKMNGASLISAVLIGGVLSRPPMGFFGDRFEPRWIMTAAQLIMLPSMILIWKAPGLTSIIISGVGFGIGYGAMMAVNPSLLGNYYGPDVFSSVNGILYPIAAPVAAIVPFGAGYIREYTGSYDPAFLFTCVMISFAVICAALMSPPIKSAAISSSVAG